MKEKIDHWIAIWVRLSPGNRALLLLVPALMALAVTVTVNQWSGEPYTALYTGLTPAGAGEVVGRLSALGVPCRVSATGSVVLVPRDNLRRIPASTASGKDLRNGTPGESRSTDSGALRQRAAVRSFLDSGAATMLTRAVAAVALLFGLLCLHKTLVHLSLAVASAGIPPRSNAATCTSSPEREAGSVGPSFVRSADDFLELARTRPAKAAKVIEALISESPCP